MSEDDDVPQLLDVDELQDGSDGGDAYDRPKVPMTLLTGYLGAGKSTLLDYILTADHGYRIAVCMNDFGDTTDIEAKSLTFNNPDDPNATTDTMLTLPNGCLCCSFKDMGIQAIEDMVAAQKDKIDWVMVELTGLADPAPIARGFWANEEMGDLILDSIVCVVDSKNFGKQLAEDRPDNEPNEAEKQVACADVILLNKTDLVTPATLKEVADSVADINPTLRVFETVKSRMPLDSLFNLKAYTSGAAAALPETESCCANGEHDHDHAHGHRSAISTVSIPLPVLSASQWDKLNGFLEALLWDGEERPPGLQDPLPDVLRTKGYARLEDGSERVVQGVADMFEVTTPRGGKRSGDPEPSPKMVFIGRNVDERLGYALRSHVGI
ncbi:COBW domain-containing protein 1 [Vanrija pseudolonga]|uniref:COBW domain-containing protein 1 n=1 Tax=Vanrija pseudolonga TaxID=143232 RepID=A0AAF0Y275_9TREE|nr:COBW domain-containing protein 1 [Vanrija pseudolonga]